MIAGLVFASLLCWKYGLESNAWKWFAGLGIALFVAGYVAYEVMKPIHIGWMKFTQVWGWLSTRIILGIFYYLVLTPIGLVLRLFGKDVLDQRINRQAISYWKKRTASADPHAMEHQF